MAFERPVSRMVSKRTTRFALVSSRMGILRLQTLYCETSLPCRLCRRRVRLKMSALRISARPNAPTIATVSIHKTSAPSGTSLAGLNTFQSRYSLRVQTRLLGHRQAAATRMIDRELFRDPLVLQGALEPDVALIDVCFRLCRPLSPGSCPGPLSPACLAVVHSPI